jgi:hypothetical protein
MTYAMEKKNILPHCKVRDLDYKPFEMENKGAVMDQEIENKGAVMDQEIENKGAVMDQEKGISKNLSA